MSERAAAEPRRSRLRAALLAAAVTAVALAVYTWKMQYRLEGHGGDTLPAQLLPISLLREGDFDFDEFFDDGEALPYSLHVVDGRVLSLYPIVPGLVNWPTYWLAGKLGLAQPPERHTAYLSMVTASVVTALAAGLLALLVARLGVSYAGSATLALLFAFGTSAWSTASRGIWQHGPALLFLTAMLLFAQRERRTGLTLAAFLGGVATINRAADLLLVAPVLALYAHRHRRLAPAMLAAFATPLLTMRLYSRAYYGDWLYPSEYPHAAQNVSALRGDMLSGLAGLLVSPARGLLVYSPLLLFALVPLHLRRLDPRERAFALAILAGTLAYALLYSRWYMWWGGTGFGPRLLTDALPGLFVVLGFAWREQESAGRSAWLLRSSFALCAGASVYFAMLGGMEYPCGIPSENRLDGVNPWLWSVGDSDIVHCSQELAHRLLGSSAGPP